MGKNALLATTASHLPCTPWIGKRKGGQIRRVLSKTIEKLEEQGHHEESGATFDKLPQGIISQLDQEIFLE